MTKMSVDMLLTFQVCLIALPSESIPNLMGLSLMGPPWLALSTCEGKAKGSGPWPLNHINCLFVPIKEASPGIEPSTKPLRST